MTFSILQTANGQAREAGEKSAGKCQNSRENSGTMFAQ